MFKNIFNKFQSPQEKEKQITIAKLVDVLKKAKNSPGFTCFVSYLYKENGEDKLNHSMFRVKFKDDDFPICFEHYQKLATNSIQTQPKNILENNQEKKEETFKVEDISV